MYVRADFVGIYIGWVPNMFSYNLTLPQFVCHVRDAGTTQQQWVVTGYG